MADEVSDKYKSNALKTHFCGHFFDVHIRGRLKQCKKNVYSHFSMMTAGKRTPKPNPRYMDEPVTSAKKSSREDLASSEHADVDDGDDEMNHSSDEPRHEGPMKKRMLQKAGIKPLSNRKYGTVKGGTPTLRKSSGPIAAKRKLVEVDIDIDDEHGKQLFLDAKRRLTEVNIRFRYLTNACSRYFHNSSSVQ